MRKTIFAACLSLCLLTTGRMYGQVQQPASQTLQPAAPTGPEAASPMGPQNPAASPSPTYPQTKSYLSFIIPWVTFQGKTVTPEFKAATTIGFPFGILVLYSATLGFSFEITPSVMYERQTAKSPA